MTQTLRANRKNYSLAFAPQTAKGATAATAGCLFIQAESVSTDVDRDMIHPQGTQGSQFYKDTARNVTKKPKIKARIMGAREFVGPILEMLSFGLPTVGAGQFTEAGDTNNNLSLWTFSGVRPGFNTYYVGGVCRLYVALQTNVINVYKDAGLTSKVATGNCANGTVTLAEFGNSGLTGTVACTSATPADNAGITIVANTIAINFATTPQRYWTCFVDDGKKLRTFADCVLKSVTFSSSDRGMLMMDCEFWAMSWVVAGSAVSPPTIAAATIYAHNGDLVVRNQTSGAPVTQDPTEISFAFDRDLLMLMGTSALPQDIISKMITTSFKAKFEPTSELDTMLALVDTFDAIDAKFTNGAKLLSFAFQSAFLRNPNHPSFSGDDVEAMELEWLLCEPLAASTAACSITYQP